MKVFQCSLFSTCFLVAGWQLLFGALLFQQQQRSGVIFAAAQNSELVHPLVQDFFDKALDILNDVEPVWNETEYQQDFAPSFVDQISYEDFLTTVNDLKTTGQNSWQLIQSTPFDTLAAVFLIAPEATDNDPILAVSVLVEEATGQVLGLLAEPYEFPSLENPPETIEEAVDRIEAKGHQFAFVVATPSSSSSEECQVLNGQRENDIAPMGSIFKLYVLGAVVDAIQEGTISWNQEVAIVDQYRSLPSGFVQNDPPGSTRTVRELAELMISISDNTATDHLLGLVGRSAVEQALVDYGHSSPQYLWNRPFLMTRELFLLKAQGKEDASNGLPGPIGQSYIASDNDETGRYDILTSLQNTSMDVLFNSNITSMPLPWTVPIAIEQLEWFASPLDLCRVLTGLVQSKDPEAARILSINPGLPVEQGIWSYIGHKGGSESGVLGLSWYLQPAPDEDNHNNATTGHRVVAGLVWDTERDIAEGAEISLLLGAMRNLSLTVAQEEDDSSESSSSRADDLLSIGWQWQFWNLLMWAWPMPLLHSWLLA